MNIDLQEIFSDYLDLVGAFVPNLIIGIFVLIFSVISGKVIYKIIAKYSQKRWEHNILSNFLAQVIKWTFYLLGMITAMNVMGFSSITNTLFAGAGVSAIVFGFAFKDIGENFLAGIILALKRPFEIGDIIEIQGDKGTVKDLDLRSTHLRNAAGKDIYIPNSSIIKNTLINYTKDGYLRVDFMIGIAPECDIERTRSLILEYLESNVAVLKSPASNVAVNKLGEFTTDLQVLFWIDILSNKELPEDFLGHSIKSKVITDVKRILDQNNIAMPSQVLEHKMYGDHKIGIQQS